MSKELFCAIIGDINKSRELRGRARVQKTFQGAVVAINHEYKDRIASKFVVTLGDEFQGLLKTPEDSLQCVRRFQELMGRVQFRFGIGLGTLSTPLVPEKALGMDGECFHRARAALEKAKSNKRQIVYGLDNEWLPMINALIGLMELQWSRLTKRQAQIASLFKESGSQESVARRLKISQPAVSKALSGTKALTDAENALYLILASLVR